MFLGVVVIVSILALSMACEVSVWRECRRDHSWLYCSKLMGGR